MTPYRDSRGTPDTPDTPGAPVTPPARPARRVRRGLAVAAVAAVTVGVGGAVYAATALGGGGAQPEDVLPARALAFAKVDLDPSAGQKVAAFRLAQEFPDSGARDEESLRDDLVGSLLGETEAQGYRDHVQPWLGDRGGIAILPPDGSLAEEPVAVVALQVTDRDAAQDGLTALLAQRREQGEDIAWGFPDGEDYVLVAERQSVVDASLGQPSLADDARFDRAVETLGGDRVALGWVDLAAAWSALPEADRAEALADQPDLDPTGQVVVGLSVAEDGVELAGRTLGFSLGSSAELDALLDNPTGRVTPTGLVTGLPADSVVAASVTGLGSGLTQIYETLSPQLDPSAVAALEQQVGLRLPGDLQALFGEELALAVGGDVAVGDVRVDVAVRSDQAARGVEVVESFRDLAAAQGGAGLADRLDVRRTDDGWTAHWGPAAAIDDLLGSSDTFRRAVPDADSSGITWYVDLRRALEQAEASGLVALTETERRNLAPLRALGYTATAEGGGDSAFRLRLTV